MIFKRNKLTISSTNRLVLTFVLALLSMYASTATAEYTVEWVGEDTETRGDWVGAYGNDAYILCAIPDGNGNPDTIWGVPILDGMWKVSPQPDPDPRALLTPDGTQRRATCYYEQPSPSGGEASFTITLSDIPEGTYQLAMYFVDWDWPRPDDPNHRDQFVSVNVNGGAAQQVSDFHDGVYEVTDVTVDASGTLIITVSNNAGVGYPNIVLSGVFLDTAGGSTSWSEDWDTQGDWVGAYGEQYYLLANMNGGSDVVGGALTGVSHWTDAKRHAWTDYYPASPGDILDPINRCQWTDFISAEVNDPIWDKYGLLTPDANYRMAACWWSDTPYGNMYPGGAPGNPPDNPVVERGNEMRIDLTIPEGCWELAFYFFDSSPYDGEPWRQQTALIQTIGGDILEEISMGRGVPFTTGVYYSYFINTSEDLPLSISIFNTMGDNVVISGIFLDEVPCEKVGSISGIKFFDADRNGEYDNNDWLLENWKIQLYDSEANLIAETLTDANGYYIFEDLECGTYIVREVLPEGWTNTTPIEQTIQVECDQGSLCPQDPVAEPVWAASLAGFWQGPDSYGNPIDPLAPNSDPNNTLGPADSTYDHTETFFSLGFDGWIILEFDNYVGGSITVFETTWQHPPAYSPYPLETSDVFVSQDGQAWTKLGTATNNGQSPANTPIPTTFALDTCIKYVKIVDTTDESLFPFNANGYDVDAVSVESSCAPCNRANFGNWAPIARGPEGLTIGFWKTNVAKNLGYLNGNAQVSADDIQAFLNDVNDVYGTDYPFLAELDLMDAYAILGIPDASDMMQKAQAHILALLLTAEYYGDEYKNADVYLPDIGQGSDYSGDMLGAIDYILELYGSGQYSAAKNLADALNNMAEEGYIWVEPLED